MIVVPAAAASDLLNRFGTDFELGNHPLDIQAFDKPVDLENGLVNNMRQQDVYYPIYNRNYRQWREKFNRGGDFAIYTRPRKIKLAKPIKFILDEICKPEKQAS